MGTQRNNAMRLRGKVRSYSIAGNYGFITSSAGDFFIHGKTVTAGFGPGFRLQVGDTLEFSPTETAKGLAAENIHLIFESS